MDILVIGSFMMDHIIKTPRAPIKGETIIGDSLKIMPGGKGINQAVAASRLGANVSMAGMLGDDVHGKSFLKVLENENINSDNILINNKSSTGVGMVVNEDDGDNRIIVIPGSNLEYNLDDLYKIRNEIKRSKILVLQLEMQLEVMEEAINIAHDLSVPVVLNPAPAQKLSKELLSKVTYLTPNETELGILTGDKIDSIDQAYKSAKKLLDLGVNNVIVTLGDKGVIYLTEDERGYIEAQNVEAINTIAAGDSFNGALAYCLVNDKSLGESVEFANCVGALTVTKDGAIPSLPYLEDVLEYISKI
ncbi:ribokinase [Helcococcus sueciensis]|uniref:ribokinase n=1 Tax=Helcococcus sueciensis TaxID=241555 RepID=UPI0003F97727|nr:ribokinase [Helcococcus sueciensis]